MSESDQKKLERLARVRENQRRSRAKKQEYVRELEQKLSSFKDEARQKDVDHRLLVQRLEAENRKLKQMLLSLGVQQEIVEDFIRNGEDTISKQKVAIPALRRLEVAASTSSGGTKDEPTLGSGKPASDRRSGASNAEHEHMDGDTLPSLHISDEFVGSHLSSDTVAKSPRQVYLRDSPPSRLSPEGESICSCEDSTGPSWQNGEDVLNTTLCAIASELIQQYNIRGVSITDIRERLQAGFRNGYGQGEGCRVQNQILFQVLDEISNGL